jgi:hypothetical protein
MMIDEYKNKMSFGRIIKIENDLLEEDIECITNDAALEWFLKNDPLLRHRRNGPAFIRQDSNTIISPYVIVESWWIMGRRHREDGPAIIFGNGDMAWFLNDQKVEVKSQEEFEKYLKLKSFW